MAIFIINLIGPMDTSIVAASVTASASIIAVAGTYLAKLISEMKEKHRQARVHLMSIRNELRVNQGLAEAMVKQARTYGFRFIDKVWTVADASCIYRRGVPTDSILKAYSKIQLFNTLNARYELIWEKENYRNKEKKLAEEHAEMVSLAGEISILVADVLPKIK